MGNIPLQHALADVAYLLREILWDLDLITSDIVAGLTLLQRYQQLQQKLIIAQVIYTIDNLKHNNCKTEINTCMYIEHTQQS